MAARKAPTQLTLNGIKMLCEKDAAAAADLGSTVTLQLVDVKLFEAENARKNIKAKISLSDGVSKMICMISDKAFNQFVSVDDR